MFIKVVSEQLEHMWQLLTTIATIIAFFTQQVESIINSLLSHEFPRDRKLLIMIVIKIFPICGINRNECNLLLNI